jgi:8-oxo-dGTP diphosphatase
MSDRHLKFAVLATDILCFRLINNELNLLIGKVQSEAFPGRWAAIGGLVGTKETAEEAAERLLKDKAGIPKLYKEQLYTFTRVDRDPRGRVVSVAYLGLSGENPQTGKGSFETKWVPVRSLPDLAYDHDEIVKAALERLRSKLEYTNIAQFLLPEEFTLSELQNVYEVVLGRRLDKRNFRKKILASKLIKDTKRTRKQGVMRPAALFEFTSNKLTIAQIL